jgi:hypothetical protein
MIRHLALLAALTLAACAETPAPARVSAPSTTAAAGASSPAPTPSNLPTTGQAGTERATSTLQQQLDQDRADDRLEAIDPEAPRGEMGPPRTPYEIGGNIRLPTMQ